MRYDHTNGTHMWTVTGTHFGKTAVGVLVELLTETARPTFSDLDEAYTWADACNEASQSAIETNEATGSEIEPNVVYSVVPVWVPKSEGGGAL